MGLGAGLDSTGNLVSIRIRSLDCPVVASRYTDWPSFLYMCNIYVYFCASYFVSDVFLSSGVRHKTKK